MRADSIARRSSGRLMLPLVVILALVVGAIAVAAWFLTRGAPGAPGAGATATLGNPETLTIGFEEGVEPEASRVVLVTIDTLRADHLETYGYFRETAPFLDRLADSGVVFERAVSASSHTGPSHATMFTGVPPGLHGLELNGHVLPEGLPTLAEAFRARGFETAAFTSVEFLEGAARGFGFVRAKTSTAKAISSAALTWLKRDRRSSRFFLWLHYYDPHRWRMLERAPADHLARIRAAGPDLQAAYAEVARRHGLPNPAGPLPPQEWRSGDRGGEKVRPGSRAEVMAFVDSYDAQIAYADAEIARVYDALEELALEGTTLWIVTSDHGEGIGSHDYAGHGWQIYDEQLRVPLIVHASDDRFAPRRVTELVSHVDLLPTVVDWLGASVSGAMLEWGGSSLVPLLDGSSTSLERRRLGVFAQRHPARSGAGDGVYALRTDKHKLIHRTGDSSDEFFDVESDPLERSNLLDGGSVDVLPSLRNELEARLRAFETSGLGGDDDGRQWMEELGRLGYVE